MPTTTGRFVTLEELRKTGLKFTLSDDPTVLWTARRFNSIEDLTTRLEAEAAHQDLDVWVYNGPMHKMLHILSTPETLLPSGLWLLTVPWGEPMAKAQGELLEFMRTPQGAAQFGLPRPLP